MNSIDKWYELFKNMRSKDLFEPLFVGNKKQDYKMIVCITLAKKECKMLSIYLLLFFNHYNTELELYLLNFLKMFKHEEAIKRLMKRFSFDKDCFYNNTNLMIQNIYQKMDNLSKSRYELFYRSYAKMLGCYIPEPKNEKSFY